MRPRKTQPVILVLLEKKAYLKQSNSSVLMQTQGVYGQPQAQVAEGTWSTGFCDCFSDCSNCCITCWCPCITFGQIAEIVDRGSTTCGTGGALYGLLCGVTGFAWVYSCMYRTKIRKQYNLQGNECTDCLRHCCCELCALTQEYRELQHRGFDPSIGWQGNMERQNAGVAMGAPVTEANMKR